MSITRHGRHGSLCSFSCRTPSLRPSPSKDRPLTTKAKPPLKRFDIADLTLYFGGRRPTFEDASRTTIAQCKYSIADEGKDFRASHAKKTLAKFAATYTDYKQRYGAQAVHERLTFQLFTNQPIYKPFLDAIDGIGRGLRVSGEDQKQAKQLKTASGLSGKPLAEFASKLELVGQTGSLSGIKSSITGLVVDWSASTNDIAAEVEYFEGRINHLHKSKY